MSALANASACRPRLGGNPGLRLRAARCASKLHRHAMLARPPMAAPHASPLLPSREPTGFSGRRIIVRSASEPMTGPAHPGNVPAEEEEEEPIAEQKPKMAESLSMESWGIILEAQKKDKALPVLLVRYNRGGFKVKCLGINGFLPFSLMDQGQLPARGAPDANDKLKAMLGSNRVVKLEEADITSGRLIFSEVAFLGNTVPDGINVGDVLDGIVQTVTDFGAFVVVKSKDGEGRSVTGLVHISEMSWEVVTVTSSVVKPGMEVRVKVIELDQDKGRLSLSMKQCQDDPLQVNLDKMLPLGEDPSVVWEDSGSVLQGLENIISALQADDNILMVSPGRQAEVQNVVSQDLQIFLTKEQVADGFNLVARNGTRVQELRVSTDLGRDEMKAVLTNVLKNVTS